MQGYILRVQKVRDEDCIVHILTNSNLIQSYRFYGARHSKITIGYKLDFELEHSVNFMPRLINTMHLGFKWLLDRDKLFFWQQFIRLFYNHLKDLEEVDVFYFELLDECATRLQRQNAKRLFIEAYIKLLKFEGRLHKEWFCFLCDEFIEESRVSLARAFLPAHENCIKQSGFKKELLTELFTTNKALNFSDEEIERVYRVVLEGF
ncbi:MAG: recombination protein RecO [Campylobacteraceae bacterium]|nr:recombination protein RecO [Campylobacteraceae bacterium]